LAERDGDGSGCNATCRFPRADRGGAALGATSRGGLVSREKRYPLRGSNALSIVTVTNRRASERSSLWLPVKVDALQEGMAVTHDASSHGVLMVAASTVEVGAKIKITLTPPGEAETHCVEGRVVRVDRNEKDPNGIWPYQIAVEFEAPTPGFEAIEAALEHTIATYRS
jgi:hypothetical protein